MIPSIKIWIRRLFPPFVYNFLRLIYRLLRSGIRKIIRKIKRSGLKSIPLEQLVSDFKSAGIKPGDVIMVHASLSQIGKVKGGAETVVKSLMEVVTQEGTILMPVYGSVEELEKNTKLGKTINLKTEKSQVGKISETFRNWPGVYRSSHPFSSVCAWGKKAEYVTSGHADDQRICHSHSPVARFVELGGKVVGIGVSVHVVSVYHVIEDAWDGFPFEVHSNSFSVTYIDAQGNTVNRQVCKYDPWVSRSRIDKPESEWIRQMFTYHLSRKGILQRCRFGKADSWTIEANPLSIELKHLASKGITMYLTKKQWDSRNESIDSW